MLIPEPFWAFFCLFSQGMKKVILTGGTGSVGSKLKLQLESKGVQVFILSRNPRNEKEFYWDLKKQKIDCPPLFEADTIIHLAGAGIADKRWTKERRRILLNSRIDGIKLLKKELESKENNLSYFFSASGINVYPLDYKSTNKSAENNKKGETFIAELVKEWELAAKSFENICCVGILRIPAVLMKNEGMLKPLAKITKWHLASPLGKGEQGLPWVHIDDLLAAIIWMRENKHCTTFNVNASNNNNADLMRLLAKTLGKKFFMPSVPVWFIHLLFGEMGSLATKGCLADNSKIKNAGFEFEHINLEEALAHLYR